MEKYDFEKMIHNSSNSPFLDGAERDEITQPVMLRMPRWWVKKLEKLAHKLSLDRNYGINKQTLILEAVRRIFIEEYPRDILKREGVLSESEKLHLLKKVILHSR